MVKKQTNKKKKLKKYIAPNKLKFTTFDIQLKITRQENTILNMKKNKNNLNQLITGKKKILELAGIDNGAVIILTFHLF